MTKYVGGLMNNMKNNKFEKDDIITIKNQNYSIINELSLLKQIIIKGSGINFEKENYCPICGNLSEFESYGATPRSHVKCPHCNSLERHRLVFYLFQQRYSDLLTNKNIALLHFAPETMFYNYFRNNKNIDYYPVDISPEIYEARHIHIRSKVDMENIPYENNKFDFIYNCHVLEHVPNDNKAMQELYRVLKDDGVCITMVPLFRDLDKTFEDEKHNTPELRLKYYGQHDHRRKYGLDFKEKLEDVGFNVEEVMTEDIIKSSIDKKILKLTQDTIFICTK